MKLLHALLAATLLSASSAFATATVGKPAPDFTLQDTSGTARALSSFKGKYVVLEWTNPECPFVQKHYNSGNMQSLQKTWGAKNVVWLTINSTHPGSGDYRKPDQLAGQWKKMNAAQHALLMDPDGKAGRLYSAKTTPHMYIIDPRGTLIYAGAIDDKPSTDTADIKTAKNYVSVALTESLAGKPVTTAATPAYGCFVKYN